MVVSYREIPENHVLRFSGTPGFKGWKDFFTKESITHPAKMNLKLLRHILEAHTSPGDVVLDPMAGTGSTVVLAAMLGRHGIAVEYEPHFCNMIRENIKLSDPQDTLTPKGSMVCIQGDARELSKLLGKSDAIVTSPPYAYESTASKRTSWRESQNFKTGHDKEVPYSEEDYRFRKGKARGNIGKLALFRRVPCPPDEATFHDKRPERKGTQWEWQKEVKIEADPIITSPPYGSDNANLLERKDKSAQSVLSTTGVRAVPLEEDNIGVLEYGDVDAIVSSPPYGNRLSDEAVQDGDPQRMSYKQAVDSIVTSPPYELTVSSKQHGKDPKPHLAKGFENINIGYSEDSDNIGNLKSESYLEAMLQCYHEFFKVLKKGGTMVLVVKNFIRNKAVVRLDLDTISIAEAAGFTLKDRWYFKLPQKSFWRILYERKFPYAPKILYEDVLIFKKEAEK